MRKRILSNNQNHRWTPIILIMVMTVIPAFIACSGEEGHEQMSGDKQLYTCGMHPQVISEEPGICPICQMNLTPIKTAAAGGAEQSHDKGMQETTATDVDKKTGKILYWRAPMDPSYISQEPGKSPMGMDLIPVYEGEEGQSGSTISIDPVTVQNIGIRTATVRKQPFSKTIRTVGHVDYNEEKLYTVNAKFPGWIEKLFVNRTGDFVKKGQPLFAIYSPELVSTQEEYLLAYQNSRKLLGSAFGDVTEGAASLLTATRQRLKFWDIPERDIERLEKNGEVRKTLTIYSPASGIVVHKNAVEGGYYMAGMDLFQMADLSTVWVYAHIFEYELPWIQLGQKVRMELPYMPGKTFAGKVDFIYPYLDSKTRDVKIRVVFDNPILELKPQMYANVSIESYGADALVIPAEAIIRSGKRTLVFLDLGNGRFRPQDVIVGPEGEGYMLKIEAGLQEGQRIVTSAQFLLDSESRLREAIQKMLDVKRGSSDIPQPQAPEQTHNH